MSDHVGNEEARRLGKWLSSASAPLWQIRDLEIKTRSLQGSFTRTDQEEIDFTVVDPGIYFLRIYILVGGEKQGDQLTIP